MFSKCPNCSSTTRHVDIIGTQTSSNPSDNRWLYCLWNFKRNNQTKTIKIHGHEILLATRQSLPKAIWCLLAPRKDNLGDYHTKHHPAQHHQDMRPILLHEANSLDILWGCVKLPHPQLRKFTDTQTSQRTLRATQVRCVLACAYTVILQNRPLRHLV
jgi:hypothetical protein